MAGHVFTSTVPQGEVMGLLLRQQMLKYRQGQCSQVLELTCLGQAKRMAQRGFNSMEL